MVGSSSSRRSGFSSSRRQSATRRRFAARKLGDVRIVRRAAERVHRLLDLAIEIPQALGLDLVLEPRHLVRGLVRIVHGELVIAVEDRLFLLHAEHGIALDVERGIELGLLGQIADPGALGDEAFADEFGVEPCHDAHQRRLARAVDAEHADLRVGIERQIDVVEDLLAGRIGLGETSHMIDELARGHEKFLNCSEIAAGISGQGRGGKADAPDLQSRRRFSPLSPSYSRRSSIWCLRGFWDLGAHGFVRLFHRLTTDTFANALEG